MPTIYFKRLPQSLSNNTVGTDSLNALGIISGIHDAQIVEESEEHAIVSYKWDKQAEHFDQIDALAHKYGLRRKV